MTHKKLIFLSVALTLGVLAIFLQPKNEFSKNDSLRENTKIKIDDRFSFTFQFSEKPKVGTVILKISVLNQEDGKVSSLDGSASYGMSSMKEHDSGNKNFVLNKQGDYLLPIDIAMPGDWEINFTFKENLNEIYKGKILLKI